MSLKNRKSRTGREKINEPLTTIASSMKKETKQPSPTCYRFSEYDKAEIALAVENLNMSTKAKTTPAKLLRALVRVNNLGFVDHEELITMIESL